MGRPSLLFLEGSAWPGTLDMLLLLHLLVLTHFPYHIILSLPNIPPPPLLSEEERKRFCELAFVLMPDFQVQAGLSFVVSVFSCVFVLAHVYTHRWLHTHTQARTHTHSHTNSARTGTLTHTFTPYHPRHTPTPRPVPSSEVGCGRWCSPQLSFRKHRSYTLQNFCL